MIKRFVNDIKMHRRVVILVIVMLIVVPLLNIKETDNSLILAVQLVQRMAVYNSTNPADYSVRPVFLSFFLSYFEGTSDIV